MVVEWLQDTDSFVIYGAQVIAYGAYTAIMRLTGRKPECFVVGKTKGKANYPTGNPEQIEGIPVRPIEEIPEDSYIVVGVTELIQKEVLPFLTENGYHNVFPLTQHEEHLLMSAYYGSIGKFPVIGRTSDSSKKLPEIESDGAREVDFALYEVRNDRDKPLADHPDLFSFEIPIQAGAALTDTKIACISDNTGDNISEKNRMYCEMTVAYWIWKNTLHEWVGLEHYRRHLLIKPEMLLDDIDAIMPLPYICYPHEVSQFLRFTTEGVFNALLKSLQELHPDEYEEYRSILYGKYQYTYDLVCARKPVYDDYCRWFFEITEYMEDKMSETVPELLETRAFSYVAEVLTNLYFMSHQKALRIRHVEKEIYV